MTGRDQLLVADLEVLAFEREPFRNIGRKESAILTRFGHMPTRYYQRLNAIIDHPAALAYDAELVGRLRRIRTGRATARRVGSA